MVREADEICKPELKRPRNNFRNEPRHYIKVNIRRARGVGAEALNSRRDNNNKIRNIPLWFADDPETERLTDSRTPKPETLTGTGTKLTSRSTTK